MVPAARSPRLSRPGSRAANPSRARPEGRSGMSPERSRTGLLSVTGLPCLTISGKHGPAKCKDGPAEAGHYVCRKVRLKPAPTYAAGPAYVVFGFSRIIGTWGPPLGGPSVYWKDMRLL